MRPDDAFTSGEWRLPAAGTWGGFPIPGRVALIEVTIPEPFGFSVVTILISGKGWPLQRARMNNSPVMYWAVFASSAIGTALLAFELLKTWGLA
jgi:hypothetical protein